MTTKIIIRANAQALIHAAVLTQLKGGFEPKVARVCCKVKKKASYDDKDPCPLIIEGYIMCNFPATLEIYHVEAGRKGLGSNTMVDILRSSGFKFDKEDIITDRCADALGQIILTYSR